MRLEAHGFGPVHDYTAGKADWLAAGLPSIRSGEVEARVVDRVDTDPVTCGPDTPAGDVPIGHVIVVDRHRVVLGEISAEAERPSAGVAARFMSEGPVTVRADEPLAALTRRMRDQEVASMLVTTPEGELLGVSHLPSPDEAG